MTFVNNILRMLRIRCKCGIYNVCKKHQMELQRQDELNYQYAKNWHESLKHLITKSQDNNQEGKDNG